MIQNDQEYRIVEGQLRDLEKWLERVEQAPPYPNQKYSCVSLQKMIDRLCEELSAYRRARPGEGPYTIESTADVMRGELNT